MATIRRREGKGGRVSWQVVLSVSSPEAGPASGLAPDSDLGVALAELRCHLHDVATLAAAEPEIAAALEAMGKQAQRLTERGTLRAGRARPVRTFAKERDAKAWARRMEADRDDGALVLPSKTRLGPYLLDHWLPAKRASLRPSTFESYRRNVARHVVPHLGHVPLQALSPDRLNAVAFTTASRSSRTASVVTSNSPALATRFSSSKLTRIRSMA